MTEASTKDELIAALKNSHQRAQAWFAAIPAHEFFARQGEVWSASDNVDHLVKAIKPVAKAMRLPKAALQTMFGKPGQASRTYEEICSIYRAEIARGAKASGSFLPNQETPGEDSENKKAELLQRLSNVFENLISNAGKWGENELDEYQLPHPLIGKLTVREMLFFTIYHNLRHASREGD